MKEQVIQLPDNLKVKEIKDGKIILVEKEKKLTYEDIAKELFDTDFNTFRIGINGEIINYKCLIHHDCPTNCTSRKQAAKLLAINKLMNVAKYLNEDWQPDWDYRHEKKYYIYIENEQIRICYTDTVQYNNIYFKSMNLVQQAIEILGEETIKLALCTDY